MADGKKFDESFVHLVLGIQTTALNALTGEQKNLSLAKEMIDTLISLQEKTKGNLNETEEGLLRTSLEQLQLQYLEKAKC